MNNLEIVCLLINTGANCNLLNNNGYTAEQCAETPEIQALFIQARQNKDTRDMAIFANQIKKDWR